MVESYILAAVRDMMSYKHNDVYADYDDQLCEFMEFLRHAYDGGNILEVSAIVCDEGVDVKAEEYCTVFYNKKYNPVDRLICVAVEWVLEHAKEYEYERRDVYIAWYAVRTILMCGFKDVSISHIEKQYWFNPEEFSKCFDSDRGSSCWYKIKRELGKIKYVIDMWYDCNNHFDCVDGENKLYDEYKKYYVVNKDRLPTSFVIMRSWWNEVNYNKYCAKHVIDDDCDDSEEYNEDEEESDYDGRKEMHEKARKEAEEYSAWQWKNICSAIDNYNKHKKHHKHCDDSDDDSYGGID